MIAPPKPSPLVVDAPQDPEALIEEARRRTQRRRRRNSSAAGLLLCVGALVLSIHGWGGGRPSPSPPPRGVTVAAHPTVMANGPLTLIRQANGRGGIYTVGRHGLGRLVARCRGCLEVEYIAWSPDGSRMALGVNSYGGTTSADGLHVIDVASGHDRQLTGGPQRAGGMYSPAWSPDGRWIAYTGDRPGTVALITVDGSQRATVDTHLKSDLGWFTWSPDGTRIAFEAGIGASCSDPGSLGRACAVYEARLDGSDVRLLARHAASPAWSPRGTVIAYEARCGIRLVTPAGVDATPRSHGGCAHIGVPGQPVFSPDGRKIAVNAPLHGARRGVYVMNADGSGLARLTGVTGHSDFGVARLAWQPVAASG
jgi:WD40-like Beta Propeller Repeat